MSVHRSWSEVKTESHHRRAARDAGKPPDDWAGELSIQVDLNDPFAAVTLVGDWLNWCNAEITVRDERLREAERRYAQLTRFAEGQSRAVRELIESARRSNRGEAQGGRYFEGRAQEILGDEFKKVVDEVNQMPEGSNKKKALGALEEARKLAEGDLFRRADPERGTKILQRNATRSTRREARRASGTAR